MSDVPVVSRAVAWREVAGEVVLLDTAGRRLMGLNATGGRVWGLIDGRRSVAEIGAALAAVAAVAPADATRDVLGFLDALVGRGLVVLSQRP